MRRMSSNHTLAFLVSYFASLVAIYFMDEKSASCTSMTLLGFMSGVSFALISTGLCMLWRAYKSHRNVVMR